MSYGIVLGDLGPIMPVTLTDSDAAGAVFVLNATTDVVMLNYTAPDGSVHSKALAITNAAQGICAATWVAGDLPAIGAYKGKATVMRAGDATFPRTFPNDGSNTIWWTYQNIVTPAQPTTNYINDDASAIVIGQPVYQTSTGHVDLSVGVDLTHATVIGLVAATSIANGANGAVQETGILTAATSQWDAVTGQSGGLTPDAVYYVSTTTPGQLTTVPPNIIGTYIGVVGYALSSSQMQIVPQAPEVVGATAATTDQLTNNQGNDAPPGEPVYRASTGNFSAAAAGIELRSTVIGLTAAVIPASTIGTIVTSGPLTLTTEQWDAVAGTSGGLTPYAPYYLAAFGFGQLSSTPPSVSGEYLVCVGFALSPTTFIIAPQVPVLLS